MIFSLKILKNYIVRCDFWSCRHFVDRLTFFIFLLFKIMLNFIVIWYIIIVYQLFRGIRLCLMQVNLN